MHRSIFHGFSVGNHGFLLVSFLIMTLSLLFSDFTSYSNYIIYPIWLTWIIYVLISKVVLNKNERTFVVVSFILLALICLYNFIGYSTMDRGQLLRNINWPMAGIVAIYAMRSFSSRDFFTSFWVMTSAILLLLIVFISEGRTIMAMEGQDEASAVASAWYGSLFMLLSGMSMIVILHVKSLLPRLFAVFVLALCLFLNIIILQRSTNVIFTMAEIGLILIFVIKRKSVIAALSVIIIGFVIYASSSEALIGIVKWLAEVSPSERMAYRFDEIAFALSFEDITAGGGSMAARSDLMNISWNTFTSGIGHIIFGAGDHPTNHSIIGDHSFFVDTLARYGIIGGFLVLVYFKKQYQIIMSFLDKKRDWALYMQCAVVFVFYVFRNYYGSLAFGLTNLLILFYFPLLFQYILFYSNKSKL